MHTLTLLLRDCYITNNHGNKLQKYVFSVKVGTICSWIYFARHWKKPFCPTVIAVPSCDGHINNILAFVISAPVVRGRHKISIMF